MIQQQNNQPAAVKSTADLLIRLSSKTGIFLLNSLSRLPLPLLYGLAAFIYVLVYHLFGYRKKVVRDNLRNAFPDKSKVELQVIEKKYFRYLSRLIVEIFKMRTISPEEMKKRVGFKNLELITPYLDQGKSIIMCSPHYGNWEWSVMALGLHVRTHIYTIYKPLSNSLFDKWFYQLRNRYGNTMVPMRNTLRAIRESENETSIFCFANDQAPPKEAAHYWIDFLHQPTSFHLGVEKIAQKTKRPVFYCVMKSVGKGHYEIEFIPISLHPESTSSMEITDTYAKYLEHTLEEAPDYWLWSHKRWKHKPDSRMESSLA